MAGGADSSGNLPVHGEMLLSDRGPRKCILREEAALPRHLIAPRGMVEVVLDQRDHAVVVVISYDRVNRAAAVVADAAHVGRDDPQAGSQGLDDGWVGPAVGQRLEGAGRRLGQ